MAEDRDPKPPLFRQWKASSSEAEQLDSLVAVQTKIARNRNAWHTKCLAVSEVVNFLCLNHLSLLTTLTEFVIITFFKRRFASPAYFTNIFEIFQAKLNFEDFPGVCQEKVAKGGKEDCLRSWLASWMTCSMLNWTIWYLEFGPKMALAIPAWSLWTPGSRTGESWIHFRDGFNWCKYSRWDIIPISCNSAGWLQCFIHLQEPVKSLTIGYWCYPRSENIEKTETGRLSLDFDRPLKDMILRFAFFRDWIEGGIPIAYWISSFYFPQATVKQLAMLVYWFLYVFVFFIISIIEQGSTDAQMFKLDSNSYNIVLVLKLSSAMVQTDTLPNAEYGYTIAYPQFWV